MTKRTLSVGGTLSACLSFVSLVNAAPITQGNLVVVRVGTGAAALGGTATASFVEEYTTVGGAVQTIALPTAGSGSNRTLTLQGSATSEGFITLSSNGQYLTLAGYDAVPGTAAPANATAATINRVVGRIDLAGNVDSTTALTDAYNGSNIRSAVSTNGTDIWTSGNGGSGQGASAGTRYTTLGGTTTTGLHTSTTNIRVTNIFGGQLYDSGATTSGPLLGVGTVGTGLPTTSGQTVTQLSGFPTASGPSSYDFWFKDSSTLYVADDRGTGSGGGIQKWTFGGSTWSLAYTLNSGLSAGTRGLAGTTDGSGNAVLYATTGAALVTVTDTGAASAFTTLATAATNTAFRGVEYIVPEPASLGLLAVAGLLAIRRRA
jgi:hypothetical protein